MPPTPLAHKLKRAAAYLRTLGPAIQGQGGDDHTFRACKVGRRFDLDEADFLPLLEDWNSTCSPPWSPHQLAAKLRSTYRNTTVARGAALDDDAGRERLPSAPPPPSYPPKAEVQWLWNAAPTITRGTSPAAAWLRQMKLDPELLGLHPEIQCRSTPAPVQRGVVVSPSGEIQASEERSKWPAWAVTRAGRWCDTGYGALIPLFDERGELRSVKARWTTPERLDEETGEVIGGAPDGMKSVGPFGFDLRGLVMANVQALYLLARGTWQEDTPREQREIWLCEGEPDFQVATYRLHNSPRPLRACFGLHPGAWTAAIARRVPRDSIVVNAEDPDRGGDKIADVVQRTLQGQVAGLKRFDARKLKA